MPTSVYRSLGTAISFDSGTIAIDATGLIVTLSGATFPSTVGVGDAILIDNGGINETRYIKTVDSTTQLTLQTASTKDGESGIVFSISRAYSTLALWESAEQKDLVSADEIHYALMYLDTVLGVEQEFTGQVTVTGWTTDANRYVHIKAATAAMEHKGVKDAGVRINRGGSTGSVITIQDTVAAITGITIKSWAETTDYSTSYAILQISLGGSKGVTVNKCMLYGATASGGTSRCVGAIRDSLGGGMYIFNTLIFDITSSSNCKAVIISYTSTIRNCSIHDVITTSGTAYGLYISEGSCSAINVIITDCGVNFGKGASGTIATSSERNISSDTTNFVGEYTTGTVEVSYYDATESLVELTGGTFPTNIKAGDQIILDTGGTPETRTISVQGGLGSYLLCTKSTKEGSSGLAYKTYTLCKNSITASSLYKTPNTDFRIKSISSDSYDYGANQYGAGTAYLPLRTDIKDVARPTSSGSPPWDCGAFADVEAAGNPYYYYRQM